MANDLAQTKMQRCSPDVAKRLSGRNIPTGAGTKSIRPESFVPGRYESNRRCDRQNAARSVELPDQRGRNCLHVFRFVVEGGRRHAVDRELEIGGSINCVAILVAPVESRKCGHRRLGAAADKSTSERG